MRNVMRQPMVFRQPVMGCLVQRGHLSDLGLGSEALALRAEGGKPDELKLWEQQVKSSENALVLSNDDEIEKYVLSIVRDYFRTTKKASVSLDATFAEHGLDSLDAIELVIQVEDELGYLIDAENLELFKKPRHFVNFIKQMEAYKTEFNRLPTDDIAADVSFKAAFPGIPGLTAEKSDEHH